MLGEEPPLDDCCPREPTGGREGREGGPGRDWDRGLEAGTLLNGALEAGEEDGGALNGAVAAAGAVLNGAAGPGGEAAAEGFLNGAVAGAWLLLLLAAGTVLVAAADDRAMAISTGTCWFRRDVMS